MNPPRKAGWIALLLPCSVLIGLLAGMLVGGRLVPKDAGLAGGPQVLLYGMVGAVVGIVLTTVFARRLEAATLRLVALLAVVLAVVMVGLVAWSAVQKKRALDERSRIAGPQKLSTQSGRPIPHASGRIIRGPRLDEVPGPRA